MLAYDFGAHVGVCGPHEHDEVLARDVLASREQRELFFGEDCFW